MRILNRNDIMETIGMVMAAAIASESAFFIFVSSK